jgi:hypothetical protein
MAVREVCLDSVFTTPRSVGRHAVLLLFIGVCRCGETPDRSTIEASAKPWIGVLGVRPPTRERGPALHPDGYDLCWPKPPSAVRGSTSAAAAT